MKSKAKKFVKNDQVEAYLNDIENLRTRIKTSINSVEKFQEVVLELNKQLGSEKVRLKQFETLILSIKELCDPNSQNFSKGLYIAMEETIKLLEVKKDTKTTLN